MYAKERSEELKGIIEKRFTEKEKEFDENIQAESLDNFWKIWSGALEHGYLEASAGTHEMNKKLAGRGEYNDS